MRLTKKCQKTRVFSKVVKILKYIEFRSPIKIDKFNYKKNKFTRQRLKDAEKWAPLPNDSALLEYDVAKYDAARILFGFSSRYNDNFNCILEHSLVMLFNNCSNPDNVAVLIAVDRDDDLNFFYNLRKNFPGRNIRFLISEERFGVEGLHKYDKIIFRNLPHNCTAFFDFSDDAIITAKDFDKDILAIDRQFADNIYIIHTRGEVYGHLPDFGKNMMLIPWLQKACSPTSVFPIISRRLIDIAQEVIDGLGEAGREWSPLSDTWIFDCYIDYIGHALSRDGFAERVVSRNMVKRFGRYDKYNGNAGRYDSRGLDKSDRAFIKMYSQGSIDIMEKICERIKNYILQQPAKLQTVKI